MKRILTLTNGVGPDRDVVVTADVTATIGSVAARLGGAAGAHGGPPVPRTLRAVFPDRPQALLLDPAATVHESSLRSGCRVEVVPVTDRRPGDDLEDAPAPVRGMPGAVCGMRGAVRGVPGASGPSAAGSGWASGSDGTAGFSRSPRVEPAHRGRQFTLPEIPVPGEPPRFPVLAVIAPVILGAVLFLVTEQPSSLVFLALSPAIVLGTWIDNRVQGTRARNRERERFDRSLALVRDELEAERDHEVAARIAESPDPAAVADAMQARSPLLWTRKPEHAAFLEVRFGTGPQPSRSSAQLPSRNAGSGDDWNRVQALADEFAVVEPVPVVERFERAGAIGVAGAGTTAADAARSIVVQLVGLHSPADLVVTAFAGGDTTSAWDWLKWLPHVDSAHSPLRASGLVRDGTDAAVLLADLEGLVTRRRPAGRARQVRSRIPEGHALDQEHGASVDRLPATPAVLVIVTAEAPADRARLVTLAEEGPDDGVFVLWLAPTLQALPVVCRTYLDADELTGTGVVGFVRSGQAIPLRAINRVDSITAARVARAIAPLQDRGARVLDETDLPHSVSFVGLHDGDVTGDPAVIVRRWAANDSLVAAWRQGVAREPGGIRAVVGQGPSEPLTLDLRAHGPHALIGGTTGSGKSEFLQTWIMSIATEYAPDRVTFLLVDYKGGAAFAECVGLPHTVGLVTDLTPHLVRRALTSLRAELQHREALLNEKGAKDLVTLEQRGDRDAPPALVIVIDEFAALVSEVPEFVDGVIDVAQRGRSLGLHLIMATQRPSGVIRDSLRANTNLRVALRVADEADSVDILGIPDAASFDPATPGRAAAKLGPGRVFDVQTAYLGGRSDAIGAAEPDIEVQDLHFGPGQRWAVATPVRPNATLGRDIERLADTIARAADDQRLELPRRPWLDQLPDVVDIAMLPPSHGATLVVGLVDEPEAQRQTPFTLDLDAVGNVAVLGTGGAGTSTLLRTIAIAASSTAREHPVVVHGLDCAGRGLAILESLPTVGSVITAPDDERVTRLLAELTATIADRSARFAEVTAGSLSEYRAATGRRDARIIVLIDGMGAFRNEYEFRDGGAVFERVVAIAAAGRALGVHLVIAADRSGAFPTALQANIGARVVLRLAGDVEYAAADVPTDVLVGAVPGRALVGVHEVQVAVPGGSADLVRQAATVDGIGAFLRAHGVRDVPAVSRLASLVPAAHLPPSVGGRPTIGVSGESLRAIGIPTDGMFVVTGPFGSGRSSTMRTLIRSVRATSPSLVPYLIVGRRSSLRTATDWAEASTDSEGAGDLATRLSTRLERAEPAAAAPVPDADGAQPFIVIENVGDFEGLPAESQVARLMKAARRAGAFVLAEADTVTAPSAWQLFSELKTARAGIALQPEETDGLTLFRTAFPRMTRADFPVGRGIMVDGGRLARVQVAFTPEGAAVSGPAVAVPGSAAAVPGSAAAKPGPAAA